MNKLLRQAVLVTLILMLPVSAGCSRKTERSYVDFRQTLVQSELRVEYDPDSNAEKPLGIAVCPVLSQKQTIEAYRLISAHISKTLGRKTVLIERRSYAEINVLLANGGADIAFLANGAYASYTGIEDIEPLVMQVRFGSTYYHSYIIVPEQSGAKELEDLRGTTFAFTDPLSYSGKIALVYMLKQIGEKPETFFGNYVYTYGHQKSLEAVANNVVDGAAIGSHVYDNAKDDPDGLVSKVRIIKVSEKGGTGPVVARKSLGDELIDAVRKTFLHLHEDPDLKEAMEVLLVDQYVEPELELYENLRNIIHEMDAE